MRRGKPTVHRQFDEATAVLVGDSLQSLAFAVLGSEQTHKDPFVRAELVLALARAAGPSGMPGGQMMELEAAKAGFDLAGVPRLQQLKTGARISFRSDARRVGIECVCTC